VRSWKLPEPLSYFLVSPEKLESEIIKARDKARRSQPGTGTPVWAYDGVAKALAGTIFASSRPHDANPNEALRALNELTKTSDHRILLLRACRRIVSGVKKVSLPLSTRRVLFSRSPDVLSWPYVVLFSPVPLARLLLTAPDPAYAG
jgi:hypothetical protein